MDTKNSKIKIPKIDSNYKAEIELVDEGKSYKLITCRRATKKDSAILLLEKDNQVHQEELDLSLSSFDWDDEEEEDVVDVEDNEEEISFSDDDDLLDFGGIGLDELISQSTEETQETVEDTDDWEEDEEDTDDRSLITTLIDASRIKTIEEGSSPDEVNSYAGYKVIYYRKEKEESVSGDIYANKKNKNLIVESYGKQDVLRKLTALIGRAFNNTEGRGQTYSTKMLIDRKVAILNVKEIVREDNSVIKELTSPIDQKVVSKTFEDSSSFITMEVDSARSLFTYIERCIDGSNIKPKKEIIADVSSEALAVYRKDNAAAINFPKIDYFKKYLNLDYLDEADYRIIYKTEDLKAVYNEIAELPTSHVIAVDTETTGLLFRKWLKDDPRADQLVTIQLSWKDDQGIVIPVRMKNRENAKMEDIHKYIKPILENRRILCQNGVADTLFCKYDDIHINLCEDTMVLAKHLMPYLALDENRGRKTRSSLNRSLGKLLDRAFNEDKIDLNRVVFKPLGLTFDFSILPDEYLIAYACPDTDRLRKLWKNLRPKLDVTQEGAYYEMVKFSQVMGLLSTWAGVKLDPDIVVYGRKRQMKLRKLLGELALACVGETPETLDIASASKVGTFLYTKLGVPITEKTKRTKTGFAADKEIISALASETLDEPRDWFKSDIYTDETETELLISKDRLNKAKYPFCVLLSYWRDLNKNITGYYNPLLDESIDGIYYIDYAVGSTNTWRSTAGIQTTKGEIKHAIKAYDDDWGVLCMDFSSQELRIASNLGRDPEMYKVLESPEADAHRAVAATIFGLKPYQVTHDQRAKGKTTNFRILYGGGARGLASALSGGEEPTVAQYMEAENIHNQYYRAYNKMMGTLKGYRDHAQKYGWVQNELGFRMVYDNFLDIEAYEDQVFDPNLKHPPKVTLDPELYQKYKSSVATASGNYPIQSYAGGLLMKLGNKFYDEIIKRGYEEKIFVPVIVHDEINVFYHKSISPFEIFEMVKTTFEVKYKDELKVPLYIGIGFGDSWGDAKSDKAELPVALQDIILEEYKTDTYDKTITCKEAPIYFYKRKEEYIRTRLKSLLQNVIDYMVYNTGEVEKLLRDNTFVLAQAADIFGIFDKKKAKYNHDKIISVIFEGTGFTKDDITYIEKEMEEDEEQDSSVALEPFRNNIHPRVIVGNNTIIIDVSNLSKTVLVNLIKYLKDYHSDEEGAKEVKLMVEGRVNSIPIGVKLKGIPISFNLDLDDIIRGASIRKAKEKESFNCKDILEINDKYILVDLKKEKNNNLSQKVLNILTKYSTKQTGRRILLITPKGTVDIGLKYNENIPIIKLQEEVMNL